MTQSPFDRELAIADRLATALQRSVRNCMLTVYLKMYCRHKCGHAPFTTILAFDLGCFLDGTIGAVAIEAAVAQGYIRKEEPLGATFPILLPTEKLLEEIQKLVDMQLPAMDAEAVKLSASLETLRSGD